jgi:hypothetical protein
LLRGAGTNQINNVGKKKIRKAFFGEPAVHAAPAFFLFINNRSRYKIFALAEQKTYAIDTSILTGGAGTACFLT